MSKIYFAILTLAAASFAGCSRASDTSAGKTNQASVSSMHSPVKEKIAVVVDKKMLDSAMQAVKGNSGELVGIAESTTGVTPYVVFVSYSAANESDPATCRLQIQERRAASMHVVERTDHLLYCSTVMDASIEKMQLSIKAQGNRISLLEERDKKNSAFEFMKSGNDWIVNKVIFNYPQDNRDTGYVDIIQEKGAFPGSLARTRVSDFNAETAIMTKTSIK